MRAKCADNDDVMKIIMTITMTMATLTITTTAMMITTMAMATPLFFLSQLRSGCRSVRKSSHPGAGAPVLAATMTSKDILMLHNDDNCVYTYMTLRPARTRKIAEIARQGYTKQGQFLSRSTGPLLPLAASERYIATLALPGKTRRA